MKIKIAHLSSSHSRYDSRIFRKQSASLAKKNLVTYIVSDGLGDEKLNNVNILDLDIKFKRLGRFFILPFYFFMHTRKYKFDIYQLHDPELLLIALFLKNKSSIVLFDSHEDVPIQMLNKPYLNKLSLIVISFFYKILQDYVIKRIDGVICATEEIEKKLKKVNKNIICIKNYPIL